MQRRRRGKVDPICVGPFYLDVTLTASDLSEMEREAHWEVQNLMSIYTNFYRK